MNVSTKSSNQRSIKEKTSISLSRDVLRDVDRLAGSQISRSAFIEQVLRRHVRHQERMRAHARDLDLINQSADQLNQEALDSLDYQAME